MLCAPTGTFQTVVYLREYWVKSDVVASIFWKVVSGGRGRLGR